MPISQSDPDWELIWAGYRACAVEAIRYLTEEEKLPFDDPLVIGLCQHLILQEAQIDLQQLLHSLDEDSGISMTEDSEMQQDHSEDDEDSTTSSRVTMPQEMPHDS